VPPKFDTVVNLGKDRFNKRVIILKTKKAMLEGLKSTCYEAR